MMMMTLLFVVSIASSNYLVASPTPTPDQAAALDKVIKLSETTLKEMTEVLGGIDNFDTYKNYQSADKKHKFSDMDDYEKIAYILKVFEKYYGLSYKQYQIHLQMASKLQSVDGGDLSAEFVDLSARYLSLSKDFASKHIAFLDKVIAGNIAFLLEEDKKECVVYRKQMIKVYQKLRLIPQDEKPKEKE
jgi:hypothetical protein